MGCERKILGSNILEIHPQLAFLDAFGNQDLNISKKNVSSHFIISATIIDSKDFDKIDQDINIIKNKFFSGSQIKSSNVGPDDDRRIKILKEIADLNIKAICFVIDKNKLTTPGFQYKTSFIKHTHKLIYKELYRAYPRLKVLSDSYGTEGFMKGFSQYIQGIHPLDIFNYLKFN